MINFTGRRGRKFNVFSVSDEGVGERYWQTKERKTYSRNEKIKQGLLIYQSVLTVTFNGTPIEWRN
jgi:hypothetical protein